MPLESVLKGATAKERRAVRSRNIAELRRAGYKRDQAVAIAYDKARDDSGKRSVFRKKR